MGFGTWFSELIKPVAVQHLQVSARSPWYAFCEMQWWVEDEFLGGLNWFVLGVKKPRIGGARVWPGGLLL